MFHVSEWRIHNVLPGGTGNCNERGLVSPYRARQPATLEGSEGNADSRAHRHAACTVHPPDQLVDVVPDVRGLIREVGRIGLGPCTCHSYPLLVRFRRAWPRRLVLLDFRHSILRCRMYNTRVQHALSVSATHPTLMSCEGFTDEERFQAMLGCTNLQVNG